MLAPDQPALTEDLVARIPPEPDDPGPGPGMVRPDPREHARAMEAVWHGRPRGGPLWVFAYGSLLWEPIAHEEERPATLHGWRRDFRLRMTTGRGTGARPGLMLGLVPGGLCQGVVQRLPDAARDEIAALMKREMPERPEGEPCTNRPRWMGVQTPGGPVTALAFALDPAGSAFLRDATLAEQAEMIARGAGPGGSCADYLHRTVARLAELGVRDETLWRLQEAVAERLAGGGAGGA